MIQRNTHVPKNRGKWASHKNTAFQGHGETLSFGILPQNSLSQLQSISSLSDSLWNQKEVNSNLVMISPAVHPPADNPVWASTATCQPQFPQESNAECFLCLLWGSHKD